MSDQAIRIPHGSLVLMVGPAGSGKTTFALKHFDVNEVVSSDHYREVVSNDATDQGASKDAFELVHSIVDKRLARKLLTVVDATNVTAKARENLKAIAQKHGTPVVALVMETSVELCREFNRKRARMVPEFVIEKHYNTLHSQYADIMSDRAFSFVVPISPNKSYTIERVPQEKVEDTLIVREGFDIIGDVHGQYDTLRMLLEDKADPKNRTLVFVGDLTDRGPDSVKVLRMVMDLCREGHLAVLGNHCDKLRRALRGNNVQRSHGLAQTMEQLERTSPEFRAEVLEFLEGLPTELQLSSGGKLAVVNHAGTPRDFVGREDKQAIARRLYGEVKSLVDGVPVRGTTYQQTWTPDGPMLVHGHTVTDLVSTPYNVRSIDQGAGFDGFLTLYRFPEDTWVSYPVWKKVHLAA